jgi:hypothetical protein
MKNSGVSSKAILDTSLSTSPRSDGKEPPHPKSGLGRTVWLALPPHTWVTNVARIDTTWVGPTMMVIWTGQSWKWDTLRNARLMWRHWSTGLRKTKEVRIVRPCHDQVPGLLLICDPPAMLTATQDLADKLSAFSTTEPYAPLAQGLRRLSKTERVLGDNADVEVGGRTQPRLASSIKYKHKIGLRRARDPSRRHVSPICQRDVGPSMFALPL